MTSGGYDRIQMKQMREPIILVNERDEIEGCGSKEECHYEDGQLHRAFSVFIFSTRGDLLLQQRSSLKITFPTHITNTCCSHPLYNSREMEGEMGVRRAAQRRLNYELGIPYGQVYNM